MLSIEECEEIVRCSKDPVHFVEKYLKTISPTRGSIHVEPYDYQKEAIRKMFVHRKFISLQARQSGKSTQIIGSALHELIFGPQYRTIFIIANKFENARELLSRLKFAHERLPEFMQMKVVVNNKESYELENGTRIFAIGSSGLSSRMRGMAVSSIYLDEAAFCDNLNYLLDVILPINSAQKHFRFAMFSSYGKGTMFQDIWEETIKDKTDYAAMKVIWSQIPGRDSWWREKQIQSMGLQAFQEQYECGPVPEDKYIEEIR